MRIAATAPGKIVLCGEYAVLDGAPAVCMAVDRRATAELVTGAGPTSSVVAPGHASGPARFIIDGGRFRWLDGGDRYAVVECVWRAGGRDMSGPLDIVLDTRAFADAETGRKIGLGSSAAITAALTGAAMMLARDRGDVLPMAIDAHRALQGGGSGADVATSVSGGLIEYRRQGARRQRLAWPEDLHFAVYWSGIAADTADHLRRFRLAAPRPSRSKLAAAAQAAAAAWHAGAGNAILDVLGEYAAALERFDADHGIGIFAAGHAELAAAAPAGVVYKPCGAGGGDIGVALAPDAPAIAAFTELAMRYGFRRLPVAMDPDGVLRRGERT